MLVQPGSLASAGQPLLVLDVPELESAVEAAEAALRSAQAYAELQRYSRKVLNPAGKYIYLTGPPELKQAADARVTQAQAALALARGELALMTLRAPYQATIVEVNAAAGEWVESFAPALTVADLDQFVIETSDLTERDVTSIAVRQPVTIYIEALDERVPGVVSAISPRGELLGGEVCFRVVISPNQIPAGLRWGMSTTITFE